MDYFTSDLHFNHKNICAGVSQWDDSDSVRPFDSLEEMNATIIDNINATVKPSDNLFILGDFAFGDKREIPSLRYRIKCENLYFIYGNHDKSIQENKEYQNLFKWCRYYQEITTVAPSGKKKICLFHYAMRVWNKSHHGAWHLYGHSHGSLGLDEGFSLDVGVDDHEFYPWSIDEIDELFKSRTWAAIDHHKSSLRE